MRACIGFYSSKTEGRKCLVFLFGTIPFAIKGKILCTEYPENGCNELYEDAKRSQILTQLLIG